MEITRRIGETVSVLFEEQITIDGTAYWTGFTKEYVRVAMAWDQDLCNRIAEGKITGFVTDDIMRFESFTFR